MKTISIVCTVLLTLACFDMPVSYYSYLRVVIFIGAILILFKEVQNDVNLFGITFIIIAIFFNPIIPVHLYKKSFWLPIDIITGIIFLVYGFGNKTDTKSNE